MIDALRTRLAIALLAAGATLLAASPARAAAPGLLTWEDASGTFLLEVPAERGMLVVTGQIDGPAVTATARLRGGAGALALRTRPVEALTDVVDIIVDYDSIGTLEYRLAPAAAGGSRLLRTDIGARDCALLDEHPVFRAVRGAWLAFQYERDWQFSERAAQWQQVIDTLALFFAGRSLSADCAAAARAADAWGCDGLPNAVTCGSHGGCCDQHDECYAARGCNKLSWSCLSPHKSWASRSLCELGGGPRCGECNVEVLACFNGPPVGPSVCCAKGNCGENRGSLDLLRY
ncbi:MAG: hypothetical protein D6738_09395 [Acidobacteria bacterium]|nr:MAG: hypothetical protein D6738_09395 [Acidobacteriota bacterium]